MVLSGGPWFDSAVSLGAGVINDGFLYVILQEYIIHYLTTSKWRYLWELNPIVGWVSCSKLKLPVSKLLGLFQFFSAKVGIFLFFKKINNS